MTPRLLYRISSDGKRELVRGAVLGDHLEPIGACFERAHDLRRDSHHVPLA